MNMFKAVLFIMCAVVGCSHAQYTQSGNRGWQNQGAPAVGVGGGVSKAPASYSNGPLSQFQNEWMPIATPSSAFTQRSYSKPQQTAASPVPQEEHPPVVETQSASTSESCQSTATNTVVHQICTCRNVPSAPQVHALTSDAAAVAPFASMNQAAEQAASAGTEFTGTQSAPVAQQGAAYSQVPSTSSSQMQSSFTTVNKY